MESYLRLKRVCDGTIIPKRIGFEQSSNPTLTKQKLTVIFLPLKGLRPLELVDSKHSVVTEFWVEPNTSERET